MNCVDQVIAERYALYHGDCVEVLNGLPEHSVGYSIFSPPFASLYTYSNSPRDMGNVRNDDEFFAHFDYLVQALLRVMKPGREVSFHCMDLPATKERDGYIGLKDFSGMLIRAFQKHGFIYHAKATIWKDPVTAMQRTKAIGLLHKSVRENAAMCRQGIPDYLVTMRAPGASERVTHDAEEAIYLADRVVVMAPRPGRIKQVVDIDLPRPRIRAELLLNRRYQEYLIDIERLMFDAHTE